MSRIHASATVPSAPKLRTISHATERRKSVEYWETQGQWFRITARHLEAAAAEGKTYLVVALPLSSAGHHEVLFDQFRTLGFQSYFTDNEKSVVCFDWN